MELLTDSVRKATEALGVSGSSVESRSHLLRGGTVLIHDSFDHVQAYEKDILIQNGMISQIDDSITAPIGVQVIDCEGKLISPGFVDTRKSICCTLLLETVLKC